MTATEAYLKRIIHFLLENAPGHICPPAEVRPEKCNLEQGNKLGCQSCWGKAASKALAEQDRQCGRAQVDSLSWLSEDENA